METWQKGIELDVLKAMAEPFKQRHKALVFGAFGLTKERDIAEAMSKKRCVLDGLAAKAVAIVSQSRGGDQHDFTQSAIHIKPGTAVVKAFAALDEAAGNRVLGVILERVNGAPTMVEIFEEDSIARKCVEAHGLKYCCSKISAGSEIKGLYTTDEHAGHYDPEEAATLTILKREFLSKADQAKIMAELAKNEGYFAQHYSDYNKRKSWTSFALRGYQDDPTFIIKPAEMSQTWKAEHPELMAARPRWTSIAAAFPFACEAARELGLSLDRVRFMRLRSKDGELSRHADITDREAGVQDGKVARLHIPLRTSDAVTFYGWTARGEKIELHPPERGLMFLDQRKPHAVTNKDPALDRVHLVIDCFADSKLRSMIANAEVKANKAAAL